jgi:Periplasmic binding protein
VKKVIFILMASILVLGIALVGCTGGGPTVPTVVKVGLVRDLTGPLAVFECGYGGVTFRAFADQVNVGGGIPLSDYNVTVPIELDVKPFDVMTWDIAAVTTALITTDKCNFIWGGPGTDCIESQAPVCNAYATLLITLEGGASTLIWDNKIDVWPYVWVTLSFSNWNQIPVLHDMLQAKVGNSTHNATAWVTGIGEQGATHGIEYTEETELVFGNASVYDYGLHPYTLSAGQASAIITAAQSAPGYDIYCFYTYPWNVITLEVAILTSGWNPPAILFGPGGNANYMPVFFGPNMNGQMSFIVADNHTSTAISDMYAGLATQAEKEWTWSNVSCANTYNYTSGWDLLDYWGMPCYWAGLQLWEDAVVQAGNLNSVDVRNALASLNTTTVLGAHTWFDVFGGGLGGGILSYDCHPGEIGQWLNGEFRVVGGNDPTASFAYPMTGNWTWLP